MGIDATMLVVINGDRPSDKQVAIWGDMLCRSIGADNFFVSDGVPTEEYAVLNDAWHAAFDAHPAYAALTAAEDSKTRSIERDKIIADIGKCPEQLRRAIEFTNMHYPLDKEYYSDIPDEYHIPGKCCIQDGDTKFAKEDEWFLDINLWTRYYGVGYERGNLLVLCAVAEWCEANIPNCEVWYGGDSSGVCVEPWPDNERRKLRAHYYSKQGRDYYDRGWFNSNAISPKPCGLCIGKGNFAQYGGGPNWTAIACASCGKNFETRDGGVTWTETKEECK